MRSQFLHSHHTDPAGNLALEEHLFRSRQDEDAHILLYRNAPCVVIGRNQNPWTECDVGWLAEQGVPLLRRLSGGGTVWHDLGNLNISFILPRREYDPARFLNVVVTALHDLGIPARRCERQSLWVDDRKVAGSAFSLTGKSAIVHACLLVSADLPRLRRSLRPPNYDLQGRFIPSVPAHVRNLAESRPGLDCETLAEALFTACRRLLSVVNPAVLELPADPPAGLLAKYRSWEWTYGRTAEFRHVAGNSAITVKNGCIAEATPVETGSGLIGFRYEHDAACTALGEPCPLDWSAMLREIPPATSTVG
jgi:lipoate-protein ligase A